MSLPNKYSDGAERTVGTASCFQLFACTGHKAAKEFGSCGLGSGCVCVISHLLAQGVVGDNSTRQDIPDILMNGGPKI